MSTWAERTRDAIVAMTPYLPPPDPVVEESVRTIESRVRSRITPNNDFLKAATASTAGQRILALEQQVANLTRQNNALILLLLKGDLLRDSTIDT